MRDTKALRQIPKASVETNLGEKSDSTIIPRPRPAFVDLLFCSGI